MSEPFEYRSGVLHCEDVSVADLAERFGTPLFIYSETAILEKIRALRDAFAELDPLVCYSVKANSNLGVLKALAAAGSGFDVVSWGEFARVLAVGGAPERTVFAGVGKTDDEIAAALKAGVLMFNVESEAELDAIDAVARGLGLRAPVALRVNPDVDPRTHRYITTGNKESKFGMDVERARALAERARSMPGVDMIGVHAHIGSQITRVEPYAAAAAKCRDFIAALQAMGHPVRWFNMGGGFGISYKADEGRDVAEFARAVVPVVKETGCRLVMEPGRVVVGNAGILVGKVVYTKRSGDKLFLIQDAAMNDLIRPSLYQAFHKIWPVRAEGFPPDFLAESLPGAEPADVVGPVCESGDFFAQDRPLPPVQRGDLLATFSAGAYAMVMASNYNTRPRAAEILVRGDRAKLVRRRETLEDLLAPEMVALAD